MFLELRFGADNGGGVKERRGVCGFKKLPPVGTGVQGYPWVACAGMGSFRKFRMYFCGVSIFWENPTFLSSAPFRADIAGESRISPRAKSALRRQRV